MRLKNPLRKFSDGKLPARELFSLWVKALPTAAERCSGEVGSAHRALTGEAVPLASDDLLIFTLQDLFRHALFIWSPKR